MNIRKVVKLLIPSSLFPTIEPYGHLTESIFFNIVNNFPGHQLKIIGVTGTNGKTTTCFMIHKMLQEAGFKVGLMTTVAYGVGQDIKPQMHHMTTVSSPLLMKRLKQFKKLGCDWVILETTSQALAQNRVWGVNYSIAVITNITHEHLSYHRTMKRYIEAKRKLFKMTESNHKGLRFGIVNADDPNSSDFYKNVSNSLTYGIEQGQMKAIDIISTPQGISYTAVFDDNNKPHQYHIHCQIPGSFNIYNSLATVCLGQVLGLTPAQIEQGISALNYVEGRMNSINEGQDFQVIVDYAHSPDSFEKLFKDLRPQIKGNIIVVFGSLGGGDKQKRLLQGQLAGKYADIVIICEEDDRQEDGKNIMDDIARGVKQAGKKIDLNLLLIHDRTEAIRKAINLAQKNDMVLLLGKGHEKTIEDKDGEHPWNESQTAKEAIHIRFHQ